MVRQETNGTRAPAPLPDHKDKHRRDDALNLQFLGIPQANF